MKLSVVIATRNRRDVLLRTLQRLETDALPHARGVELIVVDDGSTDGSPQTLQRQHPGVQLVARPRSDGPCAARNDGIAAARGQYVLFLDDDSYPLEDAASRMLDYLDAHPRAAALVGSVQRPDGQHEASALPAVMIACATCVRKSALDAVGGFPREFTRQAEEYDLSFRLWQAGWTVERFEDLAFFHEKAAHGRPPAWIHQLDLRNNLILTERYLPRRLRRIYRDDWMQRYNAFAQQNGHQHELRRARREARHWAWRELCRGRRILSDQTLEAIFAFEQQRTSIRQWAQRHDIRRIAIADFSKNIYATYRAALDNALDVSAVLDDQPAFRDAIYRGVAIQAADDIDPRRIDGIVLSNVNPAQMASRLAELRRTFANLPIHTLWEPRFLDVRGAAEVTNAPRQAPIAASADGTELNQPQRGAA